MKRRPILLAVLLLLLLIFAGWRLLLMSDVNHRLAAIRAEGFPANGNELDRWYKPVPADENAALVLTNAISLLKIPPVEQIRQIGNIVLREPGQKWSAEQTALLESYVSTNSAAMARAEEALKLPASRYPIDLSMCARTLLPHLADLRELAMLNQFHAVLADEKGDLAPAEHAIQNILGLARTLEHEPTLISQGVRMICLNMAVATLEHRLNAGSVTAVEITNLISAFERSVPTNATVLALTGERAIYATYFRMSKNEAERLLPPPKDCTEEEAESKRPMPRHKSLTLRLVGFYELDLGHFLFAMERGIDAASLPPPLNLETHRILAGAGAGAKKRFRPVSAMLLPRLGRAVYDEVQSIAWQRIAMTSLAVERFRNERGRLPESLDDLTPDFLEETPEDPFVGAGDLKYRRMEKGYMLYSDGPDEKDDNGLKKSEKKNSSDKRSYDLVFTVER